MSRVRRQWFVGAIAILVLVGSTSLTVDSRHAGAEPITPGRFNPGVDNPDFTLAADGSLVAMLCGQDGLASCKAGAGFYPSLSEYPVVSLELADTVSDVEGHNRWDGGAYDDVVHGREWNAGPGAAAATLPPDRLGISTTAADGVCPDYGYVKVPYPYLGTSAQAPWGHGGNSNCKPVAAAHTDLGPEFTGPAINWLLADYLADGTPSAGAPLDVDTALGFDLLGEDADLRTAAVVYAYHLLSPASVRTGATAVRSTLPFGVPASSFTAGANFGNAVGATPEQIARIQVIGEELARQAMRSSRWGPYHAALQWAGGVAPTTVGSKATLRVYIGGCGPSGPDTASVDCAPTSSGAVPAAPIPDGSIYGVGRPGATWNDDNGIGLVRAPVPASSNGATITPVRDASCPDTPAGWTCDDGYASFALTVEHPGHDTIAFTSAGIPDWEPEMWASAIGQDAGFASGTTRTVAATLDLDVDQPVFVRVQKRSADPTIAVTGTTFRLLDAAHQTIGDSTTDATGALDFGPIDTSRHPVPFSVVETSAAAGLQRVENEQIIGEAPYSYSTDAANPTTFVVTDTPVMASLRIRKLLSDESVRPDDMSGFAFSVTRLADHLRTDALVTDANGTTPAASVAAGIYDVCETALPAWAVAIAEPIGCQRVVVDGSGSDVTFVFTNPVIHPEAATQLAPVAAPGSAVVESVWTRNWQAAGRQVTVTAALYGAPHGATPAAAVCDASTQATATVTTSFVAKADEQVTAMPPLTIPDTPGLDFYAAGTIVDQATGALVAQLPCGDVDERVVVPRLVTTAPAIVTAGSVVHDHYDVTGLPTDLDFTAVGHFPLVSSASDSCDAPTTKVGTFDEQIAAEGKGVTTGGVTVSVPGLLYRFQESMTVIVDRPDHPLGWTLSSPTADAAGATDVVRSEAGGGVSFSTAPAACAAEESVPAPSVVTQVTSSLLSSLSAEPSVDTATVTGFGSSSLDLEVWNVQLIIGVYRHDPATEPSTWVCAPDNLVGTHAPIDITGDGSYTTDGFTGYPSGVVLSNQERLVGSRTRSDGSSEEFETPPSGCQESSESQWVPAITTRATDASPAAGTADSDVGIVVAVPDDFAGTITMEIFRYVPGGSVQIADTCQAAMLGGTLSFTVAGPGEHVSPEYGISADEVAGVQYVHRQTLLAADGRVLAMERCAAGPEVVTITRPQPTGQLVRTS